jgi:hypothetical protein
VIGIETDRGLLVRALVATGYQVQREGYGSFVDRRNGMILVVRTTWSRTVLGPGRASPSLLQLDLLVVELGLRRSSRCTPRPNPYVPERRDWPG